MDPNGAGKGLFFSYGADLTLTQQRQAVVSQDASLKNASLADRADTRFFFNRQLTLKLKGHCHLFYFNTLRFPLLSYLKNTFCMSINPLLF